MITIITICKNSEDKIKMTLDSVSSQSEQNFEYLIIDGSSSDKTLYLIKQCSKAHTLISENDNGIYHAMNKALYLAKNPYVLFLNAGDFFSTNQTLAGLLNAIKDNPHADLFYSDVIIHKKSSSYLLQCDISKDLFHHQAILYKKNLHQLVGNYVESANFTAADFFFFMQLKDKSWKKLESPISVVDGHGVSSHSRTFYQVLCVKFLLGRMPISKFTGMVIFYPFYRLFKKLIGFNGIYSKAIRDN